MTVTAAQSAHLAATWRSALLVLEHAERIGLPAPSSGNVYRDDRDILAGRLYLTFARNADVADWAAWMETLAEADRNGVLHINGTALDMRVSGHAELSSVEVAS